MSDPSHAPYFTYNFDLATGTSQLEIDSTTWQTPPFIADIQFTIQDTYYNDPVPTVAQIELYDCDIGSATISTGTVIPQQIATVGDTTPLTVNWDSYSFDDSFCTVNRYQVECTPTCDSVTHDCSLAIYATQIVDHSQVIQTGASSNCNAFTFYTDPATRSITIVPNSLDNSYSGEYTLNIKGYNYLSPDNFADMDVTFQLYADCTVVSITVPNQQFTNEHYADGSTYVTDFIGLKIHEDKSYTIDEFVV